MRLFERPFYAYRSDIFRHLFFSILPFVKSFFPFSFCFLSDYSTHTIVYQTIPPFSMLIILNEHNLCSVFSFNTFFYLRKIVWFSRGSCQVLLLMHILLIIYVKLYNGGLYTTDIFFPHTV